MVILMRKSLLATEVVQPAIPVKLVWDGTERHSGKDHSDSVSKVE